MSCCENTPRARCEREEKNKPETKTPGNSRLLWEFWWNLHISSYLTELQNHENGEICICFFSTFLEITWHRHYSNIDIGSNLRSFTTVTMMSWSSWLWQIFWGMISPENLEEYMQYISTLCRHIQSLACNLSKLKFKFNLSIPNLAHLPKSTEFQSSTILRKTFGWPELFAIFLPTCSRTNVLSTQIHALLQHQGPRWVMPFCKDHMVLANQK